MSDVLHLQAAQLRRGDHVVLREIDLTIERGTFQCIVGANGTGKTSLLTAMSGDLVDGVEALTIDGHNAHGLDVRHLAHLRSVLPQALAPRFPYAVRDVVSWGAYVHGGATAEDVDDALNRMGIRALAERPVTVLSGGEWARVRIAQALMQRPAVLFADEPDAALDRAASHALFAMLAQSEHTVVAVTHDLELAKRYASHIIGLRNGRIEFQRPAPAVTIEDCEALWA